MITKIVKVFIKLFYAWRAFPCFKVWRQLDRNSKNVVVVFPNFPRKWIQYFYSDSLVSDLALITAVASQRTDLRIQIGLKKLRKITDSDVFFNISYRFNVLDYRDYTASILQFIEQMKAQGNRLFPDDDDVVWWENKAFMHRRFDELGIRTPETRLLDLHESHVAPSFEFPFLIKEVHSSGARGIYKVESMQQWNKILADDQIKKRNRYLLAQRLLDIDRDLRVVLIEDKIIYHHWRLNDDVSEWEPTTYKKGKKGDFGNFPEAWRQHVIDDFQRIGITTGAFDLVWEKNDYSQPPVVLEISPAYFPNPEPPATVTKPYGDYKHGITWSDPWEKHFVEQANRVKQQVVAAQIARQDLKKSRSHGTSGASTATQTAGN